MDIAGTNLSLSNSTFYDVNNVTRDAVPTTDVCILYRYVSGLFFAAVCLLGFSGNTLSFYVFSCDSLRTSTSFLLQCLCVIDNTLLFWAVPVYVFRPIDNYWNGGVTFRCYSGIIYIYVFPICLMAQTATVYCTVLLVVNRYVSVCYPHRAVTLCTIKQAKGQICAVVVFAVVWNLPHYFDRTFTVKMDIEHGNGSCFDPKNTDLVNAPLYRVYDSFGYILVMCAIPLLVLSILSYKLLSSLKQVKLRRQEMQTTRNRQDTSITLALVIVVFVFIFCQIPALVNQIWSALNSRTRGCGAFHYYYSPISNFLVALNSAINFLIYTSYNPRFKKILLTKFPWLARRQQRRPQEREFQRTNNNSDIRHRSRPLFHCCTCHSDPNWGDGIETTERMMLDN